MAAVRTGPQRRPSRAGGRLRPAWAALLVAGVSMALAGGGSAVLRAWSSAAGAAASEAQVTVAFVLDFGNPAHELVGCVRVPKHDDGYEALGAFVAQAQLTAPTYAPSGLLCSIGGIPTSGCGVESGGTYAYWSYWQGTSGSWVYASTGAFAQVSAHGDVEGWRFQPEGSGRPTDPAPVVDPKVAVTCPSTTPTTTTTVASSTTTPPLTTTTQPPHGGAASGSPTGGGSSADRSPGAAPLPSSNATPPSTSALAFTDPSGPSTTIEQGQSTVPPSSPPQTLSTADRGGVPAVVHAGAPSNPAPLIVLGAVLIWLAGTGIIVRRRRMRRA